MRPSPERLRESWTLLRLAARTVAGRRFWLVPLVALLWPAIVLIYAMINPWNPDAASVQDVLIATPLVLLALGFGGRIIASEIDRRTLEIVYTVPGGAHRVWAYKLVASALLLLVTALVLALAAVALTGNLPAHSIYGALQGALVYLVLSMGWSVLTGTEAVGALLSAVVLLLNLLLTGFNSASTARLSPFLNPLKLPESMNAREVLSTLVWNRIGFALVFAALIGLAFLRAERREKLLG